MKVRDAIQALGIDADQLPGELCLVQITKKGARHYRLAEVADKDISVDLYLATGTFAPGSIKDYAGRTVENLTSILWAVLDCDLKDYVPGITLEVLRTWSDDQLLTAARELAQDVREVLDLLGVPYHRIDYTGYGIAVYIYLNGHTTADIPEIRDLNRALVEAVNAQWGSTLADPGVHDAGTRIMRLVPGPNTKGPTPRLAQTIYRSEGHVPISELRKGLQKRTRTTVGRAIPRTGSELPASVLHDLIDAVLPHWVEGNRHGLALALAGMLAKAGVSEDQAARLVEFTANAAGDLELADRLKAVETSYQRARAGLETRGLYGLRDWLPIETVEFIDRTLEPVRPHTAEYTFTAREDVVDDNMDDDAHDELPVHPLPEVVKSGLIGEYIDLMTPTTEASESYHLGVGLTMAGAMIGRRVHVRYGRPVFANLFTLLVGASGKTRKDTSITRGTEFLKQWISEGTTQRQVNTGILTDVGSSEGLLKAMEEQPQMLLYLTELSKLISKGRRQGTATILPVLMEAFDGPDALHNVSIQSKIEVKHPFLSIISATQPRILEDLMTDADVHSGFINRWLIIPGAPRAPLPWPPSVDRAVSRLLFERMHCTINDGFPDHFELPICEAARAFWSEWYAADWHVGRTDDEAAMRGRAATLVVKVALIYAVLNGDQMLTQHHLELGIAVVEWMWLHVRRMLPTWGGTVPGRIEAKITQYLIQHGPTNKRKLRQYCRARTWSTADFNSALDAMYKGGLVGIDANGVVGLRGDE